MPAGWSFFQQRNVYKNSQFTMHNSQSLIVHYALCIDLLIC